MIDVIIYIIFNNLFRITDSDVGLFFFVIRYELGPDMLITS